MLRRCSWPLLVCCIALTVTAQGQIFSQKLKTDFVPEGASASLTFFPKKISSDASLDLVPREIITAWGKKEFGFDPMLIEEATFFLKTPVDMMSPPSWAAVLRFSEMQGLSGRLIGQLDEKNQGGKTLFSSQSNGLPSFLIVDEATILAGDQSMFRSMVGGKVESPLVKLMQGTRVDGELIGVVDVENMRPFLQGMMAQIPGMMPPAITKLKQLPDMLEGINLTVDAGNIDVQLHLTMLFSDADQAEEGKRILTNAIDFGVEMAIAGMATQFDFDDPVQEATFEYTQRMFEGYRARVQPIQDKHRVTIELRDEAALAPVLVGMLLPAVQQVRHSARRTQSMNNLRQMGLACHNYASAHNGFPAQANYDKNGKPLLSWRVHMLPYLGQQELYDQFHLDEPWDSPHNRKLVSQIPLTYVSPAVGDLSGKTVYLGVAGEQGVFGKQDRGFAEITDGLSNTAMIVEVDPSQAVEWTRPVDFEPDQRNPTEGLGQVQGGGFLVQMADGSVRMVSNAVDPDVLKALFTVAGGESGR